MSKINVILKNIQNEIKNNRLTRDKSIILMGAWFGNRFADNSRYLFQYLSENKSELGLKHVVWVTRSLELREELTNMGYEAYMMDSEESVYYHKKAGIHIICNSHTDVEGRLADIKADLSNGAIKINLWHGLGGIKGVSYASKEYLDAKLKNPIKYRMSEWCRKRKVFRKYIQALGGWADAYYLSTTPAETEIFQKYFCLPKNNFIESGYPRNQKEIRLRASEELAIKRIQNSKTTVLYMPTFRENNSNYVAPISNSELVGFFEKNDWLWIEKKHGADKSNLLNSADYDCILQLDAAFDANVLLPYVDIVVTDYSSVSWDALYHDTPVVFYMPDYDYYMKQDRGFVLKPEEFIIGPAVYDIPQLIQVFENNKDELCKMLPVNKKEIFEKFWGEKKDCAQIWEDIQARIGK